MCFCLFDWLIEELCGWFNTVVQEEIVLVQLISRNSIWLLCAISNDCNFVVERDKTHLSVRIGLPHGFKLRVDGWLYALKSRDIGHSVIPLKPLIWPITELHQIRMHILHSITLNAVISSNRLRDTHAAWDVNAEDNRNIFRLFLPLELLVMYLGGCLKNVVYCLSLGDLLRLKLHWVLVEAELAIPDLYSRYLLYLAVVIKYCLAFCAEDWVSSGQLTSFLETAQSNLEDICVNFLLVLSVSLFLSYGRL